eukprot:Hpha_TRINITY_DN15495_c0_g1::TRINITY_DN15495_c0_g1_i1::g.173776::m.173776
MAGILEDIPIDEPPDQCSEGCKRRHFSDGGCLRCGESYGKHRAGHLCEDRGQGRWTTPEGRKKLVANRPAWRADNASMSCESCREEFTALHRRHHCRRCGLLVCGTCSRGRVLLAELGYDSPQRVCNSCEGACARARAAQREYELGDGEVVEELQVMSVPLGLDAQE